jgi:Rdx family
VFDVTVDGRTIFSKHAAHRFPDHGEIIDLIRGRRTT